MSKPKPKPLTKLQEGILKVLGRSLYRTESSLCKQLSGSGEEARLHAMRVEEALADLAENRKLVFWFNDAWVEDEELAYSLTMKGERWLVAHAMHCTFARTFTRQGRPVDWFPMSPAVARRLVRAW